MVLVQEINRLLGEKQDGLKRLANVRDEA